jgi:hypothetical protein
MRLYRTALLASLMFVAAARGDVTIGKNTTVSFATIDEATMLLAEKDDFVLAMGDFDRSARLKTDKLVTEQAYLEFAAKAATSWPPGDKAKVQTALEAIAPKLEILGVPLPKKVLMVRTSGKEEAGTAYARGAAIFLPPGELERNPGLLQGTIAHEFFHVISRANPELRERAYAAIGFIKCNEVVFPGAMVARKITSPDAPKNDHYINLKFGEKEIMAVPVLVADAPKYDLKRGGEFVDYLAFRWLVVEKDAEGAVRPQPKGTDLQLLEMQQVSGFFEKVGRNTNYTIHPEEILAENFKLMVMGAQGVTSSDVITRIRAALLQRTTPAGGARGGTTPGE